MDSKIIEQSGNMVTVRHPRGDEYVFDLDALATAAAEFLSDHANERRRGWTLNPPWYEREIRLFQKRAQKVNG